VKAKKLPPVLAHSVLAPLLRSPLGIVASYWLFQGMLYMDWRERAFKLILDAALAGALVGARMPIWAAVPAAHTLNMALNGHLLAMWRHMGRGATSPDRFLAHVQGIHSRLAAADFLQGAAAYGSLSRGSFRPTSDLDMRVFPKPGLLAWARAATWNLVERARALVLSFPLDLYAFELSHIDLKMRADEPPIILLDRSGEVARHYPDHVAFHAFEAVYADTLLRRDG